MEAIAVVLIVGLAGGAALGLLIAAVSRRNGRRTPDVVALPSRTTDVINVARIRVAGLGGLGLVAMALVIALVVPRIGHTLLVGAAAGLVLGLVLIVRRRRIGPFASSSGSRGAGAMLPIDTPNREGEDRGRAPDEGGMARLRPAGATRP